MYQLTGRECIYYILRHWKSIVVVVLMCALGGGLLRFGKSVIKWEEEKAAQEAATANYEHDYSYVMSLADVYNVQISAMQDERAMLQDFSINSHLNDLESTTLYCAEAELIFDSTLPDGSFYPVSIDIIDLFAKQIDYSTDWDTVASFGGVDVSYARSTFASNVDGDSSSIKLKIYGFDQEKTIEMMNIILSTCNEIERDFEDVYIGLHMNVNNQDCTVAKSSDIVEMYSEVFERIDELDEEIVTLQNDVNTLPYPATPSNLPFVVQVIIKALKYAIVGAAVGFIAEVVLLYLSFYLNGKIHSSEELEYYTGSFVLPMWGRGKSDTGLNRTIAVGENHGMVYGSAEAVDRLLTNIVSSNSEINGLLFTGTDVSAELDKIAILVKNKNHGIKSFTFAPDIMTDIDAFDSLKDSVNVVLVERIDDISVAEVKKEVEQIRLSGSRIVGAVLLR